MFRRPTEMSSDESSSSDEEVEHLTAEDGDGGSEGINQPTTLSHVTGEVVSSVSDAQEPVPAPETRRHTDMMLASLLEELSHVRAAELLNAGAPGSSYHRHSPEAQHLADKIFGQASRVFAANNLLPLACSSAELRSTRRQYIAGIDNIGLQAIQDSDLVTRDTNVKDHALVKARPAHGYRMGLSQEALAGLRVTDPFPIFSLSPSSDLRLSTPSPSHSRYRSEFQEIRMLGSGAFGQVFHVRTLTGKTADLRLTRDRL